MSDVGTRHCDVRQTNGWRVGASFNSNRLSRRLRRIARPLGGQEIARER